MNVFAPALVIIADLVFLVAWVGAVLRATTGPRWQGRLFRASRLTDIDLVGHTTDELLIEVWERRSIQRAFGVLNHAAVADRVALREGYGGSVALVSPPVQDGSNGNI